jgi:hypothetical protein
MHVTLEGLFLCGAAAFVGIGFSLGLVSIFANFDTVRFGAGTLEHASAWQKAGAAACVLTVSLPVVLVSLAITAFGLMINLDGLVPLVVDGPADQLRRGWKVIGRPSQVSHIGCVAEEGGFVMYLVFKDGTRRWELPSYWALGDMQAGAQQLAEVLGVPVMIDVDAPA